MTEQAATTQIFRIVIKASAQTISDAITSPEWSERYGYGGRVENELRAGGQYCHKASAEIRGGPARENDRRRSDRERSATQAGADLAPAL